MSFPLECPHENATGAIFFGEAKLIQSIGHTEQRQRTHPAQPAFSLLPDVCQPTVVRAAQGDVYFGPFRALVEEDTRIEYLHIDAQLVHMPQTLIDIFNVTRFHRSRHIPAELLRSFHQVFFAEYKSKQTSNLSVDHPVLFAAVILGVKQSRAVLSLRRFQIVPRARAFDHVSICVYPSHWFCPPMISRSHLFWFRVLC